jgi:hypothetical protein
VQCAQGQQFDAVQAESLPRNVRTLCGSVSVWRERRGTARLAEEPLRITPGSELCSAVSYNWKNIEVNCE